MTNAVTLHIVGNDDKSSLIDLNMLVSESYAVQAFSSGQACLDAVQNTPPDLILLNTVTTELDGFETCQKIRENSQLNHIPVIFISTDSSIESRLHSYAVGGDDYVTQPFDSNELIAKIKAAIKRKSALDSIKKEISDVTISTMDIMQSMGEMSAVVHFLQGTCGCNSYDALAKKVLAAHESLGLDVAMQIIVNDKKMHYFTGGLENPLEESVFEFVRTKGRLIDFGQRTAVNYPYVSIIVRNMPTDNKDFHGRIRDHVAIIGQGADSKVKGLQAELAVKAQRESLITIINQIESTVQRIDGGYKKQQTTSEMILSYVGESLEDSFVSLGLSAEQEDRLRGFIDDAEDKINSIFEAGLNLDKEFETILFQINEALSQSVIENDEEEEPEEDELEDETVTLF